MKRVRLGEEPIAVDAPVAPVARPSKYPERESLYLRKVDKAALVAVADYRGASKNETLRQLIREAYALLRKEQP